MGCIGIALRCQHATFCAQWNSPAKALDRLDPGFRANELGPPPVNSGRPFTGNFGSFAEYRVNACRISRKISPITEPPYNSKEIVMKNLIKTQSELAKFIAVASLFALGCTAIGGTALAQQPAAAQVSPTSSQSTTLGLVTYPVGYSDLDVSQMKGAKTLYLRIRYAAETLCESAATWGKKEGAACVNSAVNDAVARVDAPLLTQYSQLRSKGDKAGLVQLAKAN
jgi:UrcA family protein